MAARPDLVNVNVGASGAKRGRECQQQQQQQQQVVLKAQMTDEEMAVDQVRTWHSSSLMFYGAQQSMCCTQRESCGHELYTRLMYVALTAS